MPYYQKIKIKTSSTESARGVRYPMEGLFGDKKYGINFKNKLDYGSGEFIFGYDYEQNKGERVALRRENVASDEYEAR